MKSGSNHITQAREIVAKIYRENTTRDDLDYEVGEECIEYGGEYATGAMIIVRVGAEHLAISDNWDRQTDKLVGYTWTSYTSDGEIISTDGSDNAADARAAVLEFIEHAS
jgi:hypothetical protein